jgi:hypothetical protein
VALVPSIKTDGVARKESSHYRRKGDSSGSKPEMGVIWHEHPCVTVRFSLRQEFRQSIKEILAIPIVEKYLSTLCPPDHDMVQNTGYIQADFSYNKDIFSRSSEPHKLIFLPASPYTAPPTGVFLDKQTPL